MDLLERVIYLFVGCGLGAILGWFARDLRDIKKEVDEVLDFEKGRGKGEGGFMRRPLVADAMVLLVVIITVYAAVMSQIASNQVKDLVQNQKVTRCEAGEQNRNVQRELVEAIYSLATGNLQDQAPKNEKERALFNSYIFRVNKFRADMYDQIHPTKECIPYVEDDNVNPPTDPYPSIPAPKEPPR